MGRRGPQQKWWRDTATGEIVEGLIRRRDKRVVAHRSNKTFGSDPKLAVFRFRQWEARQSKAKIAFTISPVEPTGPGQPTKYSNELVLSRYSATEHIKLGEDVIAWNVPEELFWSKCREKFLADCNEAAQKTGRRYSRKMWI